MVSTGISYDCCCLLRYRFCCCRCSRLPYYEKKNVTFHTKAFRIAVGFALIGAFGAPFSGDIAAKSVTARQPIKLAAMEAHFRNRKRCFFCFRRNSGCKNKTVKYAVKVPKVLSFLAKGDFNAEVKGLEAFPEDEWYPIAVTHFAFQIMIFSVL